MGQGFERQTVTVHRIGNSTDNSVAGTFSFKLLIHYCRIQCNETSAPWINFCPERDFYLNTCHLSAFSFLWRFNHVPHSSCITAINCDLCFGWWLQDFEILRQSIFSHILWIPWPFYSATDFTVSCPSQFINERLLLHLNWSITNIEKT